ncbi:MAG: hypothetical protein WDM70_00505 [Nitrosomonadales bacterium]
MLPAQQATAGWCRFACRRSDALIITSSEALTYLWNMFDDAGKVRIAAVPLVVPHSRIADAAQGLGWKKVISTAGGDDGLLSGLVGWAKDRNSL